MTIADFMVLIAALLPYFIVTIAKKAKKFDNGNPRDLSTYEGKEKRAYDAHLNGFEVFPFFAFTVLLAEFRGAPTLWVNVLAVLFIVFRLAHARAYLNDKPSLRSGMFSLGLLCVVIIFFLPFLPR